MSAAAPLPGAVVERYLRLLGVPRRAPGPAALAALVSAQVQRVPFENVSKLLRLKRAGFRGIPDVEEHLDGVERCRLGGTCYANNFHFHRLLASLGYDVSLCGADMSRPDVHLVNLVRVDGHEYLVDGGYGAPFLQPLPRDLPDDHEIVRGRERYVLRPRDAAGRSRLDLYRDGQLRHGYDVNPAPRRIEEFAEVVAESFAPSATFMNRVTFMRFHPRRTLVLQNLNLLEFEDHESREERLPNADALPAVLEERFDVPREIAREALEGLAVPADPWG
jgi:N-hydroxyarylamine O-acetyltransferase